MGVFLLDFIHYVVVQATDRWESQILYPLYQIKLSKVENVVIVTVFCVETRRNSTENNGKRPDACYLGPQELLPRIVTRLMCVPV